MDFANSLELLGIANLQKLTPREREILYAAAYALYKLGDYKQSEGLFTKLVMQFPFDGRFWKGLASNLQMQKKYKGALHGWGVLSLISSHSPTAHFHAAECYLSLGEIEEARKALICAERYLQTRDPIAKKIERLKELVNRG